MKQYQYLVQGVFKPKMALLEEIAGCSDSFLMKLASDGFWGPLEFFLWTCLPEGDLKALEELLDESSFCWKRVIKKDDHI